MRSINKSRLEIYIESYIKIHPLRQVRNKDFIRKAIVYIEQFLENTCCSDNDAIVDLHTRLDNELTRTVLHILQNISLKGNKRSIERSLSLLENYLESPCCCTDIIVIFDETFLESYTTEDVRLRVLDNATSDILGETELGGEAIQTLCIPNEYFSTTNARLCISSTTPDVNPLCVFRMTYNDGGGTVVVPLNGEDPTVCSNPTLLGLVDDNEYIITLNCSDE